MTFEQYQSLLQELARVGGLADPTALLNHGRLAIDGVSVVLEHNADYNKELLQVRLMLGALPGDQHDIECALLEVNYMSRGNCVFSLYPKSDNVVVAMNPSLGSSMTGQDLWQELSGAVQSGMLMWQDLIAKPVSFQQEN